jgi:molybdopterin synthase sulfur carrier subunit
MERTILAFSVARDRLGFSETRRPFPADATPLAVAAALGGSVLADEARSAWRVALDHEYASWDSPLGNAAEIAFLPPVCGG